MIGRTWGPVSVWLGGLRPLPPEGQMSGIFKQRQTSGVKCTVDGLRGDAQGDRRVHGGPDKAVHLYPAAHYPRLAALLPASNVTLAPGVLGENLSVEGIDEAMVCIGDIFTLGGVRLQISQPRRPCWKISHRLGVAPASRIVADAGLCGWYFRVLTPGQIAPDDALTLDDRPHPDAGLPRLWAVEQAHRPPLDDVRALAAIPALAHDWAQRLRQRADWLERHGA